MKRIIFLGTSIALLLILWGLNSSPQLSSSATRVVEKAKSIFKAPTAELAAELPTELTQKLTVQRERLTSLMSEIEGLKAEHQEKLVEYKKMDSDFTALVMKSRKNPNPEDIKAKQAELDKKFEELATSLKNFQLKSQEIYSFQSSNL